MLTKITEQLTDIDHKTAKYPTRTTKTLNTHTTRTKTKFEHQNDTNNNSQDKVLIPNKKKQPDT